MAYQPEVVEAKKVSENENNGFFEIMVELSDHNRCRLAFQQDPKTGKPLATHIRRLHTVPCVICKKDTLCHCYERFLEPIAEQALAQVHP